MRILLILLIFSSQLALGDKGAEENVKARCAENFMQTERCCLQGQCVNEDTYALTVGPEDIRPLRRACFAIRNEQAPTCPKGRHLLQQTYTYTGTEKNVESARITRLLLMTSQADQQHPSKNEALSNLLENQQKLCLDAIEDMMGSRSEHVSSFLNICEASYKPRIEELQNKIKNKYNELLNNPTQRQKIGDHFKDPLINSLITETCPYVQNWSGVFKEERMERLFENLPRMKERLDAMITDTWGDLSDEDRKILFSRECNVISATRATCAKQPPTPYGKIIPCDGLNHHSVLATPSVKKVDDAAAKAAK